MSKVFDCVVLGVGGMGSAALYYAACKGWRTLGLDRFKPGHARGSSHGQTRIIRQAYFEHLDYVPLLKDAFLLWEAIQQQSGKHLFERTGLLQVGDPEGPIIGGIRRSAVQHSLPIKELDTSSLRQAYPLFNCREGDIGILEEAAGFLRVEDCVRTYAECAIERGADIRTGVQVEGWSKGSAGFEISVRSFGDQGEATEETIRCQRLIVTAGTWAADLLPEMASHLKVISKHQHWFRITDPRTGLKAGCPTFFFETDHGYFYGFPSMDDAGLVKIAEHSGGQPVVDPLKVCRDLDSLDLERVQEFSHGYFNTPRAVHVDHSVCMYTLSPDENFVIDQLDEDLVFACGMSGHGFKFAPVIGQALVGMLEGEFRDDMAFLRANRFNNG